MAVAGGYPGMGVAPMTDAPMTDSPRITTREFARKIVHMGVGLIAFAGKAAVLCPMTTDLGFLRLALRWTGLHPQGRERWGFGFPPRLHAA